jgi:predicted transcriptional regulator
MDDQPLQHRLSRRESQIMDAIYELGEATAAQVQSHIPDPPSNSAIRAHLRILEDKGFLTHRAEGGRYVYTPVVAPEHARRSLLDHLVRTFFGGSAPRAVAALLDTADLDDKDLDELSELIERARREGK